MNEADSAKTIRPEQNPAFVITLHGILTAGRWQKLIGQALADEGIRSRHYDYGYYPLWKFINPLVNAKQIDKFAEYYHNAIKSAKPAISLENHKSWPSAIAHSFGTYILCHALLKHPEIRFDKILLCGCILPSDFDWWTILSRGQVNFVRNEFGKNDPWTKLAPHIIFGTGKSGVNGFNQHNLPIEEEAYQKFDHSDFFILSHIESTWIPFIRQPVSRMRVDHGGGMSDEHFRRYFDKTFGIDQIAFANLPHHDDIMPNVDNALKWISINPDIYTFVVDRDDNEPVGYLNAIPATEKLRASIRSGKLRDNQITEDDVEAFVGNQKVVIYLLSIAIKRPKRGAVEGLWNSALNALLHGFCAKLLRLALKQEITVTDLYADAWTPQGRKMCEMLGMKRIGQDEFDHPIYHLDLASVVPCEHYRSIKDLAGYYRWHSKIETKGGAIGPQILGPEATRSENSNGA